MVIAAAQSSIAAGAALGGLTFGKGRRCTPHCVCGGDAPRQPAYRVPAQGKLPDALGRSVVSHLAVIRTEWAREAAQRQ